mgnify:CR=1 FL=1
MIGASAASDPPAASSVFAPSDLTLGLWLDASDATTVTLNGSAVSQIDDKSGNSRHFTQPIALAQPTYTTAGQNSKNVITFDGIGQYLAAATAADWTFLHDGTAYLIAVVARITSTTGAILGNTSSTARGVTLTKGSDTNVVHEVQTGGTAAVSNTAASSPSTTVRIHTLLADPDHATAGSRSSLFLNGGSAGSNNAATGTVSASAPADALRVGSLLSTSFMEGFVGELVIATGASATEGNRSSLVSYLNTKWAVY